MPPRVKNVKQPKALPIDRDAPLGVAHQRIVSRLRRKYTRTVKIGEQWNTYLKIDHQGFCVVEQTCHHRAKWFGKQLAIALARMMAANDGAKPSKNRDVNNPKP